MTEQAAVGLGSNLGDRERQLRAAVSNLEELGQVMRVSSLYETTPVGGPEQGTYLNAVVVLETDLDPWLLLHGLHEIEAVAGRVREVRWGPRTLDLDLLVYDQITVRTAELTVPHPRAHERAFVLVPLTEVWPDAPLGPGTASELAGAAGGQGVAVVARKWVTGGPRSG